jgi:hypothetical protein
MGNSGSALDPSGSLLLVKAQYTMFSWLFKLLQFSIGVRALRIAFEHLGHGKFANFLKGCDHVMLVLPTQ